MDPGSILMRIAIWKFYCQLTMLGLSFLYIFVGVIDVAIGVSTQFQLQQLSPLIEIDMSFIIMILIVGVLLVLLSFISCKGANDNKVAHLIVHSIFTFISILVSVVMTVLCTVTRNGIMHAPTHFDQLTTAFINYKHNGTYVDDLQRKYQCCGLNFAGYNYWNGNIPVSCYKNRDSVLITIPWTIETLNEHGVEKVSDVLYTEGCIGEIMNTVNDLLLYTSIMNYISVITLFLGFICSIVLCILKCELFRTRQPSPSSESTPQPYTVPVDLPSNHHEFVVDRPPSYQEAVSAFQVFEPDFPQIPEEIEMDYLPSCPPAYNEINFSS